MKANQARYLNILAVLALLLSGCAGLQSQGSDQQPRVDDAAQRIMAAYKMPQLLAQADESLTRSLLHNLPAGVGAEQRRQLRRMVGDAFAADVLATAMRELLLQQAKDEGREQDLQQAAAALSAPLAQRVIELQDAARQEQFGAQFEAFAERPPTQRRQQRLRQMRLLMQHLHMIEIQHAFQQALLSTMLQTRNAVVSPDERIEPARRERMLHDNSRRLRQEMEQRVPMLLLYVLRDVSDDELAAYVELQASTPLIWTNKALVKALRQVLEDAGSEVPQEARAI